MIPSVQRIVVVDLRIPFTRLVFFFVKAALAAIPAAIIVGAIAMVVSATIAALLGGNFDVIMRRCVTGRDPAPPAR
jgi:hypothetical protein